MNIFLTGLFLLIGVVVADQNECAVKRCRDNGPEIRFPFWLKHTQPEHCGYPGFDLYCNEKKDTVFNIRRPVNVSIKNVKLQHSAKVLVSGIYYRGQSVTVTYLEDCLENQLPNVSSSTSRMNFNLNSTGYTLFNCSRSEDDIEALSRVSCLSRPPGYIVYAAASEKYLYEVSLSFCRKMYNISNIPHGLLFGSSAYPMVLKWKIQSCRYCEKQGKSCRLKRNSTENEFECFDVSKQPRDRKGKLIIAGIILGSFLSVVFFVVLCYVLIANKRKKADEDKVERLLEDYKALKPSRYSYADIKIITNQFKEKLGQGGYGTVYKGRLSDEVLVAVKVLNTSTGNGEDFINEVGTIGRTHHVNVVRLVGYCADGFRRALIYEFLPNDTLQKFLSSENSRQELSLSSEKLQNIALGIAEGIEYLHQGCDQQILHFDIKPQNVLMDQNFNPKISDFGLAKLCSKDKSVISMTLARGTIGYIAPEVFSRNFGKVSYKSDIYSFGMLLLDMVGARKGNQQENTSESYFLERTYKSLAKGEGLGFQIDINGDPSIAKKLTVIGLWCIQWFPSDRPSMRTVIQMLEGENCPVIPPNPFASMGTEETTASATVRRRVVPMELESISETE